MNRPTLRFRAQLPWRRSYKPAWRPTIRLPRSRANAARQPEAGVTRDCAPEGAWIRALRDTG